VANFILQFAVKKLSKLDQKYSEELKDAKQKNFVTQHAAFRYLALDYGLNFFTYFSAFSLKRLACLG